MANFEMSYSANVNAIMACREMANFLRKDPQAWTQGAWARDMRGNEIDPRSDKARAFCLGGLMARFTNPDSATRERVVALMHRALPPAWCSVPSFNDDSTTHVEDIIRVLEEAASDAERRMEGAVPISLDWCLPSLDAKSSSVISLDELVPFAQIEHESVAA